MRSSFAATALAAALPLALAQTSTDCDPTKKSCPSDVGLSSSTYSADFSSGSSSNASWSAAAYTTIDYTSDGAVFSIANANQAPTIQTDFYFLFGRVDVVMKASPGTGIVSSIVLESDDLDEIDWEFLGGSNNQVQSDFFGKGNTTSYNRAQYHDISDTQGTWHTYSVDWTSERLEWLIDGSVVRTLPYSTSLTLNGQNYPQTPMRLKLGNWCGGCSSAEGTVEWAGGKTTFGSDPYEMTVKSVSITNANPACSYEYSDMTGSWESITINTSGDSCNAGSSGSSSASGSSTVSPTGSTSGSITSTETTAPTSSHEVVAISEQTGAVVSKTITGSAYSTNTAAISSLNAGNSLMTVTTGASSQPTGINATTSSGGSGTVSGPSSSSSAEPSTGDASSIKVITAAGSLFSLALALFL